MIKLFIHIIRLLIGLYRVMFNLDTKL